ncbi:hypothetical protein ACRARG_04715 [Pseudooceanicola sp. C21-150M6]|uniref:hypothetical protein n=1 Tax=Pseudooceanicola sp. C21-150M6 TaxID=3434355 RepID=UPI003D7FBD18
MTPASHRYLTARNAPQMRRDAVTEIWTRRRAVVLVATVALAVVAGVCGYQS